MVRKRCLDLIDHELIAVYKLKLRERMVRKKLCEQHFNLPLRQISVFPDSLSSHEKGFLHDMIMDGQFHQVVTILKSPDAQRRALLLVSASDINAV